MILIKEILASDTYGVRNAVLRKGKPIESCLFSGDELPTTKHFGLFYDDLIGIISLFKNSNALFTNLTQIQIRGMAVLQEYQGLGLGERLIQYSEEYLTAENDPLIWFNARVSAIGFYEKMGYQTIGNEFEIEGIGKHLVMFKKLS
jgi:GNAT superfamily N-acetyltransferase